MTQTRVESGRETSQAWYVDEGQRGQRLLDNGRIEEAKQVSEAIRERLGESPSYARAVVLGRLSRCSQLSGRPDAAASLAREGLDVAGSLAPTDGVKSLRGTLRSALGDALRAGGEHDAAR